jgi:hypothetical protein
MKRSELEITRHHTRSTLGAHCAQCWLFKFPAKCSRTAGCDDSPPLCCTLSLCVGTVTCDVSRWGGQFVTYAARCCTSIYPHNKSATFGVPICNQRTKHNRTICSFAQIGQKMWTVSCTDLNTLRFALLRIVRNSQFSIDTNCTFCTAEFTQSFEKSTNHRTVRHPADIRRTGAWIDTVHN